MTEKKTGIEALVDAAADFRTKERTLHLRLEERIAQLCQWAEGFTPEAGARLMRKAIAGEPGELFDELDLAAKRLRTEVAPLLADLRELRGHARTLEDDPPTHVGAFFGTAPVASVVPIDANRARQRPLEAVDAIALASYREDGESITGETLSECFNAYNAELWRVLAERGLV